MRQLLPEYMAPSTYVTLDRLPLTGQRQARPAALPEPDPGRGGWCRIVSQRIERERAAGDAGRASPGRGQGRARRRLLRARRGQHRLDPGWSASLVRRVSDSRSGTLSSGLRGRDRLAEVADEPAPVGTTRPRRLRRGRDGTDPDHALVRHARWRYRRVPPGDAAGGAGRAAPGPPRRGRPGTRVDHHDALRLDPDTGRPGQRGVAAGRWARCRPCRPLTWYTVSRPPAPPSTRRWSAPRRRRKRPPRPSAERGLIIDGLARRRTGPYGGRAAGRRHPSRVVDGVSWRILLPRSHHRLRGRRGRSSPTVGPGGHLPAPLGESPSR